ncbi:MAG: alpha/beta hydrolase [Armatimonadetes bacterium]|nr:alpha/beta hydrolase [Armatimonadota bacterium]
MRRRSWKAPGPRTGRWLAAVLVVVVMTLASAGSAWAQRRGRHRVLTIPDDVKVTRGVVYGLGGGRELRLDLYSPRSPQGRCPAVVFLHGGGWRSGSPGQFAPQSIMLAEKGYVCACPEYRLSGEARFPAAVEDAKSAVRWLRAEAERLGVDTQRIAIAGGSAGGHLAAMIAVTGPGLFEGQGGHADQSSAVQLAVLFNPVTDMIALGQAHGSGRMLLEFLGKPYEEAPDLWAKASPVTYVTEDDPPTLVLHGTADQTVPFAQSQAFVTKLQAAGVEAELFAAEGAGHGFFNRPPWLQRTFEAMLDFLDEHFRAQAAE